MGFVGGEGVENVFWLSKQKMKENHSKGSKVPCTQITIYGLFNMTKTHLQGPIFGQLVDNTSKKFISMPAFCFYLAAFY